MTDWLGKSAPAGRGPWLAGQPPASIDSLHLLQPAVPPSWLSTKRMCKQARLHTSGAAAGGTVKCIYHRRLPEAARVARGMPVRSVQFICSAAITKKNKYRAML